MKIRKEILSAIFAIAVLALGYWGIKFLKGIDVLSENSRYYAYYEKSNGLETSAPVLYRDYKIGTVTNISLDDTNSSLKVTITVKSKYKIPDNSVAVIGSSSLIGGKAIMLELGDSEQYLTNNDSIASKIDTGLNDQIDEVKTKMLAIMEKLNTSLEGINTLLSEENTRSISQTMGNLSTLSNQLNQTVAIESKKIGVITSNLETLTGELNEISPSLKNSVANLDVITTQVKDANIGEVIDSVNSTLELINSTEGSIGKFFKDPSLYNSVTSATTQLNSLLTDLETNPKRYVHFSLFGRKDSKNK